MSPLRAECRALRRKGWLLREIAAHTFVPIATVSEWCRGVVRGCEA